MHTSNSEAQAILGHLAHGEFVKAVEGLNVFSGTHAERKQVTERLFAALRDASPGAKRDNGLTELLRLFLRADNLEMATNVLSLAGTDSRVDTDAFARIIAEKLREWL